MVLDTQCGAGSALMAASRYLKNLRLMGYEKDEEMWAAAVIMSQLSGLEMELHLEDGARADLYESCDLVISNPVYGTDTIKDEELIDQLPGELKTVRGRYHMELTAACRRKFRWKSNADRSQQLFICKPHRKYEGTQMASSVLFPGSNHFTAGGYFHVQRCPLRCHGIQ